MAIIRNAILRLACVAVCLAGITPAALPPGGVLPAGQANAAAPALVPEDAQQWLRNRLSGGRSDAANLPPLASGPQPAPPGAAVPVPYRTWLPPAGAPAAPRLVRGDKERPLPVRPAADLPPVAPDINPRPPAPVYLPAVAPPRIDSPDPARAPLASLAGRGRADRPSLETDPTPAGTRPAALARTAPPREKPAPPLLLKVPDPSGQPAGSDIHTLLADEDPPVVSPGVPAKPKLSP